MFGPISLQRIEGLILLISGIVLFSGTDHSWWWFAGLLLVPDVSMVGYLRDPGMGAALYNLVHSLIGPGVLVAWHLANGSSTALFLAAIWIAHIGMDRLFGYGLKYPDDFHHTHLGWIGGGQGPSDRSLAP